MEELQFKHSVPIQLRFNDTDSLGHVNNSVYFSFYDLGKTSYFSALKGEIVTPQRVDVVVAHAEVDFLKPVFLDSNVEVQTTVSHIGNKSFTLVQRIIDVKHNDVKCVCKTVMVGFDYKNNVTIPISDDWRQMIEKFEGRKY